MIHNRMKSSWIIHKAVVTKKQTKEEELVALV